MQQFQASGVMAPVGKVGMMLDEAELLLTNDEKRPCFESGPSEKPQNLRSRTSAGLTFRGFDSPDLSLTNFRPQGLH